MKEKRTIGGMFRAKSFRRGTYSAVLCLVSVAVAVFLNLLVAKLPTTATKFDVTAQALYTLSEQSEQLLSGLQDDVTIYLIAQTGNEDSYLTTLLGRYTALSSHITVENRDPVLYPNFVSQYTTDSLSENSLIVVCGDRTKVISNSDLFPTDMDYTSYSYTTSYDGENQITSAISYVTSDDLPVVYELTGHGEAALSSSIQSKISSDNLTLSDLSLLSEDAVPDDAGCVLMVSPTSDLSTDEKDKLLTYLEGGGRFVLLTDYTGTDMPNLAEVMAYYGVESQDGIILEGNASYRLSSYPHYLLPKINSHEITSALTSGNYSVLMPVCHGIKTLDDYRSSLNITSLLETSSDAYLKTDGYDMTTMEKEDGDEAGPFSVGMAISESHDNVETRLVWLATSQFLSDDVNQAVSGANSDLFLACLGWMCGSENSISIHSKSLDSASLTVSDAAASLWSAVFVVAIPIALLILGGAVVIRRKKR